MMMIIGLFYLIIFYLFPIIFYLIPHRISNKKWLIIYGSFWLSIIAIAMYDIFRTTSLTGNDEDLSFGGLIVAGYIFLCSVAAITGVISRAMVVYLTNKGREVDRGLVHVTSLIFIQFLSPILLGLIGALVFFIIDLLAR